MQSNLAVRSEEVMVPYYFKGTLTSNIFFFGFVKY